MKFLAHVDQSFTVSRLGCFLLLDYAGPSKEVHVPMGSRLWLRRADGCCRGAVTLSLDFADSLGNRRSWLAIGVGEAVAPEDVPKGTEVWVAEA